MIGETTDQSKVSANDGETTARSGEVSEDGRVATSGSLRITPSALSISSASRLPRASAVPFDHASLWPLTSPRMTTSSRARRGESEATCRSHQQTGRSGAQRSHQAYFRGRRGLESNRLDALINDVVYNSTTSSSSSSSSSGAHSRASELNPNGQDLCSVRRRLQTRHTIHITSTFIPP